MRVEKSCKYVQALAYLTNSPIKTPFPIFLGMLLFKNGKLTIGKSNESLLSYIEVDMKPSFITILRSKKCVNFLQKLKQVLSGRSGSSLCSLDHHF